MAEWLMRAGACSMSSLLAVVCHHFAHSYSPLQHAYKCFRARAGRVDGDMDASLWLYEELMQAVVKDVLWMSDRSLLASLRC